VRAEPALREAREKGLVFYFTGRPCRRGHVAKRWVAGRGCVACAPVNQKRRYDSDPESYLERQRQWQSENRHVTRGASKRWKEQNPQRNKEGWDRWAAQNRDHLVATARQRYLENRDEVLAYNKVWNRKNPGARNALTRKRGADKLRAVPPWLTEQHYEQIKLVYVEARRLTDETGVSHHVDHIFPLRGRNCSGLHVPWNLQILTASENSRKRNKVPADRWALAFKEHF